MIYGVKYQNYLKGYYGVVLFEKEKDAESCYNSLEVLWNTDKQIDDDTLSSMYESTLIDSIGQEEEFSYKDLENNIIKDFEFTTNNNGYVSVKVENLRIVNNSFTTIPC